VREARKAVDRERGSSPSSRTSALECCDACCENSVAFLARIRPMAGSGWYREDCFERCPERLGGSHEMIVLKGFEPGRTQRFLKKR
jgi:hypothetical protein